MSFFKFSSFYTKEEVLNSLINENNSSYKGGYSFLSPVDKDFVIKGVNNAFILTAFKAIIDLYSHGNISLFDFIEKMLNIVIFKIAKIFSYILYPIIMPISRYFIKNTTISISQIFLKMFIKIVTFTIIPLLMSSSLSQSIFLFPIVVFCRLIEINLYDIISEYLQDSFNERIKKDIESYDNIHSIKYKAKSFKNIASKFIATLTAKIANFLNQDIVMIAMIINNIIFDIFSMHIIFNVFLNSEFLSVLIPVVATSYIISSLGYNISIHNASNTGKGIPNPEDVDYKKQINNIFPITRENLQNLVSSLNQVERYNMKIIFLECIKTLNQCLTSRKFIDIYKRLHNLQGEINTYAPKLLNDIIMKSISDCITNGVFTTTPGISIKNKGPLDDDQIKVVINLINVFKAINTAIDQYNTEHCNSSLSMLNQYQVNPENSNYNPELFKMVVYNRAKKIPSI